MDPARLKALLESVREGATSIDDALGRLRDLPFEGVDGIGAVDHHRELRVGIPEVVLGEFKTAEQVVELMKSIAARGAGALATRLSPDKAAVVTAAIPEATYDAAARTVVIPGPRPRVSGRGAIAVVSAGTSDEPVAAEAVVTAAFLGNRVERIRDVGVAGVHRLIAHKDRLRAAEVVIVVAGMEGALPSVVGGLIDRPVIAVPTSVGYGVSLGGYVAMLGMLSSCAAGVMVVNIDNGFGAAVAASQINRRRDGE